MEVMEVMHLVKDIEIIPKNNKHRRLIPPLVYWKARDDPTDIDKCVQLDENLIKKE